MLQTAWTSSCWCGAVGNARPDLLADAGGSMRGAVHRGGWRASARAAILLARSGVAIARRDGRAARILVPRRVWPPEMYTLGLYPS